MFMPSALRGLAAATTLAVAVACTQSPQTPVSPSAAPGSDTTAAADGSTLKVTAPTLTAPANQSNVESSRPTLTWTASTGRHATVSPIYEVVVLRDGAPVYTAQSAGTTHQVAADAQAGVTYTWRVRAVQDGAVGPWSATWSFSVPAVQTRATGNPLPFPPPPECGAAPNQPGDRSACALAVARLSPEWGRCAGGNKVGCFRYSRHLALALAAGDPRWGMISKNPGDTQCTMDVCGYLNGEGYGEDVVAYLPEHNDRNRWIGFDVVGGAGAPGATVNWARLSTIRPGNQWVPVPF